MDLFDIVGPIMVGPSSSHTAGAVRMGYVAGKLLGEPIQKAEILLYGSFLATGEGHGTRKAIVAVCWECRQMITRLRIVSRLPHSEAWKWHSGKPDWKRRIRIRQ